MQIDYKNWMLEKIGKVDIQDEIFDVPLNEDAIAQVVRWQRAKSRSGNHETKTRAQVSGTGKKPWAQKETGKARQGSLRSPQFRGGGVVFGPHKRSYEFSLNKKFRRLAAISAISEKIREGNVDIIESFLIPFKKTSEAAKWKDDRNIKSVLFVIGDDVVKTPAFKVFSNIPYCDFLPVRGFNVLDCVKHQKIIFDLNSIKQIANRYSIYKDLSDELEKVEKND